jgi:hypothetical protein
MQSNAVQNLKEEIPKSIQEEIKYIYQTAIQMLKAFHGIFPPKNNEQEQKVTKSLIYALSLGIFMMKIKKKKDQNNKRELGDILSTENINVE